MQDITVEFANTIIGKAQDQIKILIGRQWPEISRIIEKDGEITISAAFKISNREAEEGTHAAKDNRIRLAMSFSEKFSDAIESDLDAHPELPLGEPEVSSTDGSQGGEGASASAQSARKTRKPKTQNAEATTPLEAALAQAAAGVDLPRVKGVIMEGTGEQIISAFTEAAGQQGWPIACISVLTQVAAEADSIEAIKQTLGAHIEPEIQTADPALAQ